MRIDAVCAYAALVCAVVLGGCSTPLRLKEPDSPPVMLSYAASGLKGDVSSLPVAVDVSDCPELAFLTKKGVSGVTRIVCPFPLQDIVEREFSKMVAATFKTATREIRPLAELKVSARRVILRKNGDAAFCEMELDVAIVNPYEDKKPYFKKVYNVMSGGVFVREDEVPECVYVAVQDAVRSFMVDLPSNAAAIARIGAAR